MTRRGERCDFVVLGRRLPGLSITGDFDGTSDARQAAIGGSPRFRID